MSQDPELKAMGAISNAVEDLDDAQRVRVIQWVCARYNVGVPSRPEQGGGVDRGSQSDEHSPRDDSGDPSQDYESFADLYDQANPSSSTDKALIGGYWLQVVKGDADFVSQAVNTELKELGHKISNITSALTSLIEATPRLVMQVRKSGNTRQARKKYKLTAAGIKRVNQLLSSQ